MRRLLWLVLALCSGTSQAREMADNSAISNYYCMVTAVYFESKGEPLLGQVAVRDVINNRGADTCSIVFKPWQFSWTHQYSWKYIEQFLRGEPKLTPAEQLNWQLARKAVAAPYRVLDHGYKHFHSAHITRPWSKPGVRIGRHKFMKGVK
jgi:hypothetical protein